MQNTQAVQTNHEYRNIPIATLVESPTNARKRFDEKTLGELAASFKTQGVLELLLVRPLEEESKFEVVIGARRLEIRKSKRS
jgi:ParB family chromosome partitioning protein